MLGRPLFVWLILVLLIVNIYGTLSGLLQVIAGDGRDSGSTLIISGAASLLAIVLVGLIWSRHPLTRTVSWLMFALLAGNQLIAFARHNPNPDFDMSQGEQRLYIGIFTAAMILLYALPALYFQRSRYLKGTSL